MVVFRKEAGGRMADRDGNLLLWCGLLSPWEAVSVGELETPGDVAVDSAVAGGSKKARRKWCLGLIERR